MSVRVRFAPSPTGNLHIGGVRTALFNWLHARHTGGTFLLRIEDTDTERSTLEYERVVLRELRWCGIDWDEGPEVGGPHGPYRQSERMHLYKAAADKLIAEGHAYRCTCAPERIETLRAEQLANKQQVGYDGHCRELGHGPDCGTHCVRLKVPDEGTTEVDDLFKGLVRYENKEIDDLVLVRSDGVPTYNFVVVIDDVDMQMTHVLRGEEHLNNTPKQLLVYKALGAQAPRFGHMPLILGQDGSKLSKRHGATSVASYREMGIHPEALVNYLARLGWSKDDLEVFDIHEIVPLFDIGDIGKSPGKWDVTKLSWVNGEWMKRLPPETVAERLPPFLAQLGLDAGGRDLLPVVLAFRERARTLVDMAKAAAFLFQTDDAMERDEAAVAAFLNATTAPVLAGYLAVLEGLPTWSEPEIERVTQAWCEQTGTKLGKLAQPVRVALSGQKVGPGLFQALGILGRDAALRRLRAALDTAQAAV
jgi:glutamyl-tRNA synthetase